MRRPVEIDKLSDRVLRSVIAWLDGLYEIEAAYVPSIKPDRHLDYAYTAGKMATLQQLSTELKTLMERRKRTGGRLAREDRYE